MRPAGKSWDIREGDALEELPLLAPCFLDSMVTDPPAGISFMGKEWDSSRGGRDGWVEYMSTVFQLCLQAMKPGAHALVWAIPRTSHWTATALEVAGFEVRDVLTHHFGTGFPKSLNLDGEWEGWGTALKPSTEHWILARLPFPGTVAANVAEYGTGALNVEGCRVPAEKTTGWRGGASHLHNGGLSRVGGEARPTDLGRWPPNLLLTHAADCGEECVDGCPVREMDEQSGESTSTQARQSAGFRDDALVYGGGHPVSRLSGANDHGGASRFFPRFRYEAKASSGERNAGLADGDRSTHPTVKAIALMRWLCRLITPPGGVVLDPFLGSGSTMIAALQEGFRCVGIERDPEYAAIARRRVEEDMPLFNRNTVR